MRTSVFCTVVAIACGCTKAPAAGLPAAENEVANERVMEFGTPSRVPGVEGTYCTGSEIGGFSGTIIELQKGKFRYWFYSDVGGVDEPTYPIVGEYELKDGALTLKHEQVNQAVWYPDVVNGIPVLWREDGLRTWKADKKVYDYAVMIKTEGTVSDEGMLNGPSIKVLYDPADASKAWQDPFIYGPQ